MPYIPQQQMNEALKIINYFVIIVRLVFKTRFEDCHYKANNNRTPLEM